MAEERMLNDEILLGLIKANSGGGGGGTTDYSDLSNKPQINNVTLSGNKSASDLGLVASVEGKGLSSNDFTDAYKTAIGDNATAISGIKNGEEINSFGGVESALTDKADASDVKKEFGGTLEEWNALTIEQKKEYDTYDITDDYSDANYIYLPTIYSEEEREVGVWEDGKPLYQKTWKLSSTITINISGVTLPSQIDNDLAVAENIINASAVRLKVDNGSVACIPLCVWKAGTSYSALCSDDWVDVRDITIQYTKTTDTAGSGTWTPTGQYAHHYSTDEQIVGTWIDGSTLYEKTIVLDSLLTINANSWSTEIDLVGDRLVNISALNSIDKNVFPIGGNITNNKLSVLNTRGSNITVDTFIVYYTKAS